MTQMKKTVSERKFRDFAHQILFKFFSKNAKEILERKCSATDEKTRFLVMQEDERNHYGDLEILEEASEFVLKSFTIDRIEFIKKNLNYDKQDIIIDLGDSNGIFLRSLPRDGISVNISDSAVTALKKQGMECIRADIEHLPFKNNSIHTVFLFETLEHVQNPVDLLKEIGRVCRKSAIISIPYVRTTNILPYFYDRDRPIYQHHIFEFTPSDFAAVVSHTQFRISNDEVATVLDGKSGILTRCVFLFWRFFKEKDMFCGCFKKFYICRLIKNTTEPEHIG